MSLKSYLGAVRRQGFVRSAGILVGGTATAQALTVLALPLLTRLYTPEDFSLLAVYVAMLTMVSVIACLRLEIAIPIPEDDTEAANLLALGFIFASLSALIAAAVVVFFGTAFFQAVGQPQMQRFGWLLPLGIWLAGSYAAFQFWSTRKKRFPAIAMTRMTQAGSGLAAQLGLGLVGVGAVGLMLGHALMAGAGIINLAWRSLRMDRSILRTISLHRMAEALGKYRKFPQYSTFESLANVAAIQLPVILIAALAVGPEAGFVLLAMRAMGIPVTLIGGATGQVYLSHAREEMNKGRLPEFTTEVLSSLARIGIAPLVFIAVIAPPAFAVVFGEEWRRAGELVMWMTPWFVFKLLSSPVSMVMHVRMMQRTMLVLMVAGLLVRISMTFGASVLNPVYIAEGYALSGAVFYLVAFVVYLFASGAGLDTAYAMARVALLPVAAAVGAGVSMIHFAKWIGFS